MSSNNMTGGIFGSQSNEEFVRDTMLSQDIAAEIIASLGEEKALSVPDCIKRELEEKRREEKYIGG